MANNSRTSADAILKQVYSDQRVENFCFGEKQRPFMKMVKKIQNSIGANYPLPFMYGYGGGGSADFTTSQTNSSANSYEKFELTPAVDYETIKIDGELITSQFTTKQTFQTGFDQYMKSGMQALSNDLEFSFFSDGTGVRGQISSGYDSTTVTLTNASHCVRFTIGMKVDFAATATGSITNSSSLTVNGVNHAAGTLTLSATPQSVGAGASDYIFRDGDAPNGGGTNLKLTGVSGWVPSTAPTTGDSHFGVDRSVYPVLLAGDRYDGSGQNIVEAVRNALDQQGSYGVGFPNVAFMNPRTFGMMVSDAEAQVQRSQGGKAVSGFNGIDIIGNTTTVKCVSAPMCPTGVVYCLDMSTWGYYYNGQSAAYVADLDGNRIQRIYNADAYEVRLKSSGQLGCKAPGHNIVVTVDLPST